MNEISLGMQHHMSDGIIVSEGVPDKNFVVFDSTNFQSESTMAVLDASEVVQLRDWLNEWLDQ